MHQYTNGNQNENSILNSKTKTRNQMKMENLTKNIEKVVEESHSFDNGLT